MTKSFGRLSTLSASAREHSLGRKMEYEEFRRAAFSHRHATTEKPTAFAAVIYDRAIVAFDMRTGIPPVMRQEVRQQWVDARQEAARQAIVREMLL